MTVPLSGKCLLFIRGWGAAGQHQHHQYLHHGSRNTYNTYMYNVETVTLKGLSIDMNFAFDDMYG